MGGEGEREGKEMKGRWKEGREKRVRKREREQWQREGRRERQDREQERGEWREWESKHVGEGGRERKAMGMRERWKASDFWLKI